MQVHPVSCFQKQPQASSPHLFRCILVYILADIGALTPRNRTASCPATGRGSVDVLLGTAVIF